MLLAIENKMHSVIANSLLHAYWAGCIGTAGQSSVGTR